MICRHCRTNILSRIYQQHTTSDLSSCARQLPLKNFQRRNYSDGKPSVAPSPPPAPRQPVFGDVSIPSAISSATPGVSQPLSTPEAGPAEFEKHAPPTAAAARPVSTCLAGTKLNGLNYVKNKPDVFAKEDSEYPEWLWGLLEDAKKQSAAGTGGVDVSSLNKKQRKRHAKKMTARLEALPVKIPAHHQATDITPASYNRNEQSQATDPIEDVTESLEKRTEVTKSARASRRKEIKESNFLRGL